MCVDVVCVCVFVDVVYVCQMLYLIMTHPAAPSNQIKNCLKKSLHVEQ